MKKAKYKAVTDILSMLLTLGSIITGFKLHQEVWHMHLYDDTFLWGLHESVGLILMALVAMHCVQHSFWFRNYSKIRPNRKIVSTILLILGILVCISGVLLLCGSHSEAVSHLHYISAILFTVVAVGHVAKRWKILRSII